MHTKNEVEIPIEELEKYEGELTERMQLFSVYFVKSHNATKSYMKAYGCNYQTAAASASRLLKNVKIKAFVDELKAQQLEQVMLREEDVIQKYIDIAFADVNDFVDIDASGNFFALKDEIDGSIVKEIKNTKYGLSIKLDDRMRALKELKDSLKEKQIKADAEEQEQMYGVVMLAPVLEENLDEYEQECDMGTSAEAD